MAAGLQNKQPRLLLPQVSPTRSSMLLVLRQISAQELSNSVATSGSTTAPQAFGVPPTPNPCPGPPAATSILHIAGHRAASALQQRLPSDHFGFVQLHLSLASTATQFFVQQGGLIVGFHCSFVILYKNRMLWVSIPSMFTGEPPAGDSWGRQGATRGYQRVPGGLLPHPDPTAPAR